MDEVANRMGLFSTTTLKENCNNSRAHLHSNDQTDRIYHIRNHFCLWPFLSVSVSLAKYRIPLNSVTFPIFIILGAKHFDCQCSATVQLTIKTNTQIFTYVGGSGELTDRALGLSSEYVRQIIFYWHEPLDWRSPASWKCCQLYCPLSETWITGHTF